MHALIAPTSWRAPVAFTLNRLATAKIECLILGVTMSADPGHVNVIFVMWDAT